MENEQIEETSQYMTDVRTILETWRETNHYETRFVTVDGNFKAELKKFNLVENTVCKYEEERSALRELVEENYE